MSVLSLQLVSAAPMWPTNICSSERWLLIECVSHIPNYWSDGVFSCSSCLISRESITTTETSLLVHFSRLSIFSTHSQGWDSCNVVVYWAYLVFFPEENWGYRIFQCKNILQSTLGEKTEQPGNIGRPLSAQTCCTGTAGNGRRRGRKRWGTSKLIRAASQSPPGYMKHWWTW